MKFIGIFLLSLVAGGNVIAQNYPVYGGYFVNPYLYNPAEAATDRLQIFGDYRNQWVGLNGAPRIYTLGATTLLNDTRVGVGMKVSSLKRGFLTTSDAMATYAYGVPIDKESRVFFGLSGGAVINSVDWTMVNDASDPALGSLGSSVVPAASFGMLYRNNSGINFGLTLPKIIETKALDNFSVSPLDNIIFSAYYSKRPADKIAHATHKKTTKRGKTKSKYSPFEFYTLYRYSKLGSQFEVTGKMNFTTSLWLAASYRQHTGFIPSAGIHIGDLSVNYYYEWGLGGDIPMKTHEISLGLRLGAHNKFREKVPPVIAHRVEQQAIIAKNNPPVKTQPVKTEPVKTEPKPEVKKQEPVIVKNEPKKEEPVVKKETRPVVNKADSLAAVHVAEREQLNKHIDDHKDGAHDDEHSHPINQRHEFVKRGTHQEELEEGTFVIAGAFSSRINSDHYAKSLKGLGYTADFGHLSAKNLWYVYIADEEDIEVAKKERDELQKKKIFKDVWLMTVHK